MRPRLILMLTLLAVGCTERRTPPQQEAPAVTVANPVEREMQDYIFYTGRTDAVETVNVVAQVSGYLVKIAFKDGDLVKKNDLLYQIDPRIYQAAYDQAAAQVQVAEAKLSFADATLRRDKESRKSGAVSQQELERSEANKNTAAAELVAAQSEVARRRVDLDFTKVTAPISGRISRTAITLGNNVAGPATLLTTIVSLDPVFVYFDVDEPTLLRIRQLIAEGRIADARATQCPVEVSLGDDDDYQFKGIIDFIDNRVSASTGTLRIRGQFDNSGGKLAPGMFVRVRLPLGKPEKKLCVLDRVVLSSQGNPYVLTVNAENQVVAKSVKLGIVRDHFRAIEDGLTAQDRVITIGQQRVRPNLTVKPVDGAMSIAPESASKDAVKPTLKPAAKSAH